MTQDKQPNALDFLKNYWFIIIFAGSIIVGYGKLMADTSTAIKETDKLTDDVAVLQTKTEVQNTQISNIEDTTQEIKSDLKELLKIVAKKESK